MKKILIICALVTLFSHTAQADRVVILDANNNVRQEIYTQPMSSYTQTTYTQQSIPQQVVVTQQAPQQVVVTQPVAQEVVVVRPTPSPRAYYYDAAATSLVAGFTGALIGSTIFHHHGHGHHSHGHHGHGHHRR